MIQINQCFSKRLKPPPSHEFLQRKIWQEKFTWKSWTVAPKTVCWVVVFHPAAKMHHEGPGSIFLGELLQFFFGEKIRVGWVNFPQESSPPEIELGWYHWRNSPSHFIVEKLGETPPSHFIEMHVYTWQIWENIQEHLTRSHRNILVQSICVQRLFLIFQVELLEWWFFGPICPLQWKTMEVFP